MAEQRNIRIRAPSVDHTVILDPFPELWTEILTRVPHADRLCYVPLVSRRFNEACRDPSLWPELRLLRVNLQTEARWRSFLRWLAVRAPGLQTFVFGASAPPNDLDTWSSRTRELFTLLAASAPQLRSLEHVYPDTAPMHAVSALPPELGQFSQLTSLILDFGRAPVTTAQVNAMVQTLPALHYLALQGARASFDEFPANVATRCLQLIHLKIRVPRPGYEASGVLPKTLGLLAGLTTLDLKHSGVASLPDSISRLTGLKELLLGYQADLSLPLGMTACQQLTRLDLTTDTASPVLARLRSLRRLSTSAAPAQAPHANYWTHLTALTQLRLDCRGVQGTSPVPARLGGMLRLRKLGILCAVLADVPTGPYLRSLESLELTWCIFRSGVPANLAAARQLRHLELVSNIFEQNVIELNHSDVVVLSSMPLLATLVLESEIHPDSEQWDEGRLANLRAACIAKGHAPPAVSLRVAKADSLSS